MRFWDWQLNPRLRASLVQQSQLQVPQATATNSGSQPQWGWILLSIGRPTVEHIDAKSHRTNICPCSWSIYLFLPHTPEDRWLPGRTAPAWTREAKTLTSTVSSWKSCARPRCPCETTPAGIATSTEFGKSHFLVQVVEKCNVFVMTTHTHANIDEKETKNLVITMLHSKIINLEPKLK